MGSLSNLTFFERCHRPLYYKAKLNQLRNGELLSLGGMRTPMYRQKTTEQRFSYLQAYLKKEDKGMYSFVGLCTQGEQDIWTQGNFTLSKGVLSFSSETQESHLNTFFWVCSTLQEAIDKESAESWFNQRRLPVLFDGLVVTKHHATKDCFHVPDSDYWESSPIQLLPDTIDTIQTNPLNAFWMKYQENIYANDTR